LLRNPAPSLCLWNYVGNYGLKGQAGFEPAKDVDRHVLGARQVVALRLQGQVGVPQASAGDGSRMQVDVEPRVERVLDVLPGNPQVPDGGTQAHERDAADHARAEAVASGRAELIGME